MNEEVIIDTSENAPEEGAGESPAWIYRLGEPMFDAAGRSIRERITVFGEMPDSEGRWQAQTTLNQQDNAGNIVNQVSVTFHFHASSVEGAFARLDEEAESAAKKFVDHQEEKARQQASKIQIAKGVAPGPRGRPKFRGRGK